MRKLLIVLILSIELCVSVSLCRAQGLTGSNAGKSKVFGISDASPVFDSELPTLRGEMNFDERSTDSGLLVKTRLPFEIEITQGFDANDAAVGTPLRGRLLSDIIVDGVKVASIGDDIQGEITKIWHGERTIKSYLPTKHFLNAQGRLFITFSRIVGVIGNRRLAISAILKPNTQVERDTVSKLHFVVNKDGELTVKYGIAKYLTVDGLISAGVLASGPAGLVIAPAVTGTAGVVCPSYANGRPVDSSEKQSKVKNFVLGAGRGVPGASIIFGLSTKGLDVALKEGDRVKVELKANSTVKTENTPCTETNRNDKSKDPGLKDCPRTNDAKAASAGDT